MNNHNLISNNLFEGLKSGLANLLKRPGDSISAEITPTNRQVIKINTDELKLSVTRYPNGTMVETRSYRSNN